MPLYEYECDACGHRFEIIQKFSDSPVETCPVCGGAVRKLQSAPAFQFRGSGWYVTDYARKEQPAEAKTDGGAAAESPGDKKEGAGKAESSKKDKEPKVSAAKASTAERPAASGSRSESTKASRKDP